MDQTMLSVNYENIGRVIRIKRQEKDLTQDELGQLVGCCGNYISHIEANGHAAFETLVRIAYVLDFPLTVYLENQSSNETLDYYWHALLSSMRPEEKLILSKEMIRTIGQVCPEIMISNTYFERLQKIAYASDRNLAAEDPMAYGASGRQARKRITHPRKKK